MKGLIVTADDFGAAPQVNEAVERAHRHGILTAASLMVSAPAARDAVARAKAMPSLRVGLHLVLVEARPTLPAAQIPDLVDRDGFFRTDMARAGAAMFFLPKVRRQLAAEIEAQFAAFASTGLPLDHINAHKHFHLHPTIAALIVSVGRKFGLRAARVPLEPAAVLAEIEPGATRVGAAALTPFALLLRRRFRTAGLLVPDQVFGLRWSGAMTGERLRGIIADLPKGLSEIYMHPASGNDFVGAAKDYCYSTESDALIDPQTIEMIKISQVSCGGFGDFLDAAFGAKIVAPSLGDSARE